MAATELTGLAIMGLAVVFALPLLASFAAYYTRNMIMMIFAGIVWAIPAVYGFANRDSAFDVYGITATLSLMAILMMWSMPLWHKSELDKSMVPAESEESQSWDDQWETKPKRKNKNDYMV